MGQTLSEPVVEKVCSLFLFPCRCYLAVVTPSLGSSFRYLFQQCLEVCAVEIPLQFLRTQVLDTAFCPTFAPSWLWRRVYINSNFHFTFADTQYLADFGKRG